MSANDLQDMSLRPGRFEYKRLAWAFVISLAIHLLCYGGYEFTRMVLPGLLERVKILTALAEELRPKKPVPPPQPGEAPLVFVEVNPAVATPDPPKQAKFYSSQNSKAANPKADIESNIPKIDGNQQHVAKTQDAPRKFDKLQPSAAPAKEAQTAKVAKPKPVIGDLAMAKPDPNLRPPDNGNAEETRPRTLAEAMMRHPNEMMPGQKMRQEGGVHRHLAISTLDAKAMPFGEYDREFIEAVQQHWYDLLDSMNFSDDRHGQVCTAISPQLRRDHNRHEGAGQHGG